MLPLVERQYNVTLTKDPEGRATMGCSSGASAALIMAWYHPELYHRVLSYSGHVCEPAVAAERRDAPAAPGSSTSASSPTARSKPIRIWMQVGDRDLFNPNVMRDDMHDWVVANGSSMAKALAAKKYQYQFVFRAERRALRSRSEAADAAAGAGMVVEGVSGLWRARA